MSDTINIRQWRQDYRIDNGARSGTLTAEEAQALRQEQRLIGQVVQAARADGYVDPGERYLIHVLQDVASSDIYELKHNDVRKPGAEHAVARLGRQDARIDHGVRSGALTAAEARELRQDQREIRQAVHAARADGHIDAGERLAIRGMQDSASREIAALKHNDTRRPDLVLQGPTDNPNTGPFPDLSRRPDLVLQAPKDHPNTGPFFPGSSSVAPPPSASADGEARSLDALVRSARLEHVRG